MEWDGSALEPSHLTRSGYTGNELKLGSSFAGRGRRLFRPAKGATCFTVKEVLNAIAETELHYRRATARFEHSVCQPAGLCLSSHFVLNPLYM